MIEIGPHTFSVGDARRTLGPFDAIWAEMLAGRDPALVAALRAPVDSCLRGLDPHTASAEDLVEPLRLAWGAMLALGPALRAAGVLPGRAQGSVSFLARGRGGVPKERVDTVDVTHRGVVGDVQRNRTHHGRPFQALCLWCTEVIDGLRAEGHPIAASLAGENITLSGIPWPDVVPGARLLIGTVVCEVSGFATPCRQNSPWFVGGDVSVIGESSGPVGRMYATVLEPGRISVGDAAVLEP